MKANLNFTRCGERLAQCFAAALLITAYTDAVAQLTGSYDYLELGVPATYQHSYGYGINNLGQVVGACAKPPSGGFTLHVPFVYTPGAGMALVTVPGTGGQGYAAFEINDAGRMVGGEPSSGNSYAYYSDLLAGATKVFPLAANKPGAFYGVNASGVMAGQAMDAANNWRAITYSGGAATNLGVPAGTTRSFGMAINSSGQVVGYAEALSAPTQVAFTSSGGVTTSLHPQITPLQAGVATSAAFDVNDAGVIVGRYSNSVGSSRPFVYQPGVGAAILIPTYTAPATAVSINNVGQVIILDDASSIGGLFYQPGQTQVTLYDLVQGNTGGQTVNFLVPSKQGKCINDWGQIVVTNPIGTTTRAVLLTPRNPLVSTTNGGTDRNTKFVGGMAYNKFTPLTNPAAGSLGSTVSMPGGTASGNKNVQVSFQPGGNFSVSKASDIVDVTGTGTDLFVLQLSYNEAQANALFGGEANAFLSWYDTGNVPAAWKNAVLGNSNAGAVGLSRNQGARAFNITIDLELGRYGVDTTANRVWAVLDHNSAFGVIKTSGFSSWAAAYPGLGDLDDDDDLDGLVNLAEYALGTNPKLGGSSGPGIALNSGTPRFTVNKGAMAGADPDIQYLVQFSPDLSDWTTQAPAIIQNNATTIVAEPPSPVSRGFFRLVITQTP
jgi:hypothetical protein